MFMSKFEPPILHFKAWRNAAGMTQEAVALKTGYSRGHVAKAETQPVNITLGFMAAFAEVVGAPSVASLFTPPRSPDELRDRLLLAYRFTPDHKKGMLVDVACGFADFTEARAAAEAAARVQDNDDCAATS